MKHKWLIDVILLVYLVILVAGFYFGTKPNGPAMAKIRYFDGSLDTLEIEKYWLYNGTVYMTTDRGWNVTAGMNNVIIIEGDDGSE